MGRDKLGNTLSHPILVLSGIPQGSNLGSIVFFYFSLTMWVIFFNLAVSNLLDQAVC